AAAAVVTDTLAGVITDRDPIATGARWADMVGAIRNQGRPGVVACAISAVDIALWDLKAKLLGISVATAVGAVHDAIPLYGSGGFTNFTDDELTTQLTGWVDQGLGAVKIKVGRDPTDDPRRVAVARAAIGDGIELL